jgi:chloramphenicol O-acetyltransferase type A
MKYIDLENWKRKEHFAFFNRMDYPQYNICLNLDVTKFKQFTKQRDLPFYYAMIYAVTRVVNETEEFKYRIRDGKVLLHDTVHPSFTDMNADKENDLFKFLVVDMTADIGEFVKSAQDTNCSQTEFFPAEKLAGRDDLIYITCIPWISFTHISHTISLNKNDSVPRISWGKYFMQNGKIMLPFSVQVNHAFVDGVHVGKYVGRLQHFLDETGS